MGRSEVAYQTSKAQIRRRFVQVGAALFLLAAMLIMNACGTNSSLLRPDPAALIEVDHRGPTSTNSTLLFPRHYDRARVQTVAEFVDQLVGAMSLDEELGQLFIAEFTGTDYNSNNAAMISQMHAGGIILYSFSMQDAKQTQTLINSAQAHAKIPLLISVDEEGGCVDRLNQIYDPRPGAPQIAATGSTDYAYPQGAKTAQDMTALGFNVDLAPDVDVELVPGRDLLCRTFGTTPDAVTKYASAYLNGLQQNGVVGTLKHFPGLGDALGDAHLSLPVIKRTREQIESVELAPYRAMIDKGQVQIVMTTDLLMPALDPAL
ncbi:MAG TPA: glycoside hydrolase family 3 N-terminal domain-containing protein, partial [Ktedonobacterales bacterium]|nr:glycoside hydrolase family 3 N-terminal domain-containing protein [Ktedonobacterales bacterium]